MMKTDRKWICIEVNCGEEVADELAWDVADSFAVGVEMTVGGFRFYTEKFDLADESRLQSILEQRQPLDGLITFSRSVLVGDEWADRWKEFFKPLRIGRHFVVCPTWEEYKPETGDLIIVMDPGRAFGTGQHETTRMCLEWLEELAGGLESTTGHSVLDVGTGSGILAMGAALLGFAPVVGVDNDPDAVEVALENVALNRLNDQVRLLVGSIPDVDGQFDLVVSNIQAGPLVEMASALAHRLEKSGRLVLSGILVEQMETVRAAFESQGLRLIGTRTAGEWCSPVFA